MLKLDRETYGNQLVLCSVGERILESLSLRTSHKMARSLQPQFKHGVSYMHANWQWNQACVSMPIHKATKLGFKLTRDKL